MGRGAEGGGGKRRGRGAEAEAEERRAVRPGPGQAAEHGRGARGVGEPEGGRRDPPARREQREAGRECGPVLDGGGGAAEQGVRLAAEPRAERAGGEGDPAVGGRLQQKVGPGEGEGEEPLAVLLEAVGRAWGHPGRARAPSGLGAWGEPGRVAGMGRVPDGAAVRSVRGAGKGGINRAGLVFCRQLLDA